MTHDPEVEVLRLHPETSDERARRQKEEEDHLERLILENGTSDAAADILIEELSDKHKFEEELGAALDMDQYRRMVENGEVLVSEVDDDKEDDGARATTQADDAPRENSQKNSASAIIAGKQPIMSHENHNRGRTLAEQLAAVQGNINTVSPEQQQTPPQTQEETKEKVQEQVPGEPPANLPIAAEPNAPTVEEQKAPNLERKEKVEQLNKCALVLKKENEIIQTYRAERGDKVEKPTYTREQFDAARKEFYRESTEAKNIALELAGEDVLFSYIKIPGAKSLTQARRSRTPRTQEEENARAESIVRRGTFIKTLKDVGVSDEAAKIVYNCFLKNALDLERQKDELYKDLASGGKSEIPNDYRNYILSWHGVSRDTTWEEQADELHGVLAQYNDVPPIETLTQEFVDQMKNEKGISLPLGMSARRAVEEIKAAERRNEAKKVQQKNASAPKSGSKPIATAESKFVLTEAEKLLREKIAREEKNGHHAIWVIEDTINTYKEALVRAEAAGNAPRAQNFKENVLPFLEKKLAEERQKEPVPTLKYRGLEIPANKEGAELLYLDNMRRCFASGDDPIAALKQMVAYHEGVISDAIRDGNTQYVEFGQGVMLPLLKTILDSALQIPGAFVQTLSCLYEGTGDTIPVKYLAQLAHVPEVEEYLKTHPLPATVPLGTSSSTETANYGGLEVSLDEKGAEKLYADLVWAGAKKGEDLVATLEREIAFHNRTVANAKTKGDTQIVQFEEEFVLPLLHSRLEHARYATITPDEEKKFDFEQRNLSKERINKAMLDVARVKFLATRMLTYEELQEALNVRVGEIEGVKNGSQSPVGKTRMEFVLNTLLGEEFIHSSDYHVYELGPAPQNFETEFETEGDIEKWGLRRFHMHEMALNAFQTKPVLTMTELKDALCKEADERKVAKLVEYLVSHNLITRHVIGTPPIETFALANHAPAMPSAISPDAYDAWFEMNQETVSLVSDADAFWADAMKTMGAQNTKADDKEALGRSMLGLDPEDVDTPLTPKADPFKEEPRAAGGLKKLGELDELIYDPFTGSYNAPGTKMSREEKENMAWVKSLMGLDPESFTKNEDAEKEETQVGTELAALVPSTADEASAPRAFEAGVAERGFENKFGIGEGLLMETPTYRTLSPEKRELVLRNFEQLTLQDITREARETQKKEWGELSWWKKGFQMIVSAGIKPQYRIAQIEKELLKNTHTNSGDAFRKASILARIEALAKVTEQGPKVVNLGEGRLEMSYVSARNFGVPPENLTNDEKVAMKLFNEAASQYAQLPHNWLHADNTGRNRDENKIFEATKRAYDAARTNLIDQMRESFVAKGHPEEKALKDALSTMNKWDEQVTMNQLLNSHPNAETALLNIRHGTVLGRAAKEFWKMRGSFVLYGAAGRAAAVATLGALAAPTGGVALAGLAGYAASASIGAGVGYGIGRSQEKTLQRERRLDARTSSDYKAMTEDLREEITYRALVRNADKSIKQENGKNVTIEKKRRLKEFTDARFFVDRIDRLTKKLAERRIKNPGELRDAEAKFPTLTDDSPEKIKLAEEIKILRREIALIERKIAHTTILMTAKFARGEINYGSYLGRPNGEKGNTAANLLSFAQALAKGRVITHSDHELMTANIGRALALHRTKLSDVKKEAITSAAIDGAQSRALFSLAGGLIEHAVHALGSTSTSVLPGRSGAPMSTAEENMQIPRSPAASAPTTGVASQSAPAGTQLNQPPHSTQPTQPAELNQPTPPSQPMQPTKPETQPQSQAESATLRPPTAPVHSEVIPVTGERALEKAMETIKQCEAIVGRRLTGTEFIAIRNLKLYELGETDPVTHATAQAVERELADAMKKGPLSPLAMYNILKGFHLEVKVAVPPDAALNQELFRQSTTGR